MPKETLAVATLERIKARADTAEEKVRRVVRIIDNGRVCGRSDSEILEAIRDELESATAPWPPAPLRHPASHFASRFQESDQWPN